MVVRHSVVLCGVEKVEVVRVGVKGGVGAAAVHSDFSRRGVGGGEGAAAVHSDGSGGSKKGINLLDGSGVGGGGGRAAAVHSVGRVRLLRDGPSFGLKSFLCPSCAMYLLTLSN